MDMCVCVGMWGECAAAGVGVGVGVQHQMKWEISVWILVFHAWVSECGYEGRCGWSFRASSWRVIN